MDYKKIIILFFVATAGLAQNVSGNRYFQELDDKLSVQLFYLTTSNSFDFNNGALQYTLKPNKRETVGLALQYAGITFSFGFAPKFLAENQDNAHSKMSYLNFDLYPGQLVLSFDYYRQKGMTVNARAYNFRKYYERLVSTKIGGSTSYVFNKDFSYKATLFQNEKQLQSAGSFVPSVYYYYTDFSVHGTQDFESVHYFDLAIAPGYCYNWVINKNFLIGGGASLGVGFNHTVDSRDSQTAASFHGKINIAAGYNSERLFYGANLKTVYLKHNSDAVLDMGDNIVYTNFFIGYRFDAPSFLEEQKNKIMRMQNN